MASSDSADRQPKPLGDTESELALSEHLSQKALKLKSTWRRDKLDQPLLVEFSGTPKSGKSTTIGVVHHFFHRHDFHVYAPSEGVSKRTPRLLKKDLLYYNTWAACYALSQMFEAMFHSERYDIAIFDRGIFDVLAWMDWLCQYKQRITVQQRDDIQKFMTLELWQQKMDLVVMFECAPDTSMRRENKDKLVEKTGQAMNPESLAALLDAYGQVYRSYASSFRKFMPVSTEPAGEVAATPRETAAEIVEMMLTLMEGKR